MQYEKWLDFDTNPLYALMHESIYCQVKFFLVGNICLMFSECLLHKICSSDFYYLIHNSMWIIFKGAPSSWSAHRIRAETGGQFDATLAVREGRPVLFTGEVLNPSIFQCGTRRALG